MPPKRGGGGDVQQMQARLFESGPEGGSRAPPPGGFALPVMPAPRAHSNSAITPETPDAIRPRPTTFAPSPVAKSLPEWAGGDEGEKAETRLSWQHDTKLVAPKKGSRQPANEVQEVVFGKDLRSAQGNYSDENTELTPQQEDQLALPAEADTELRKRYKEAQQADANRVQVENGVWKRDDQELRKLYEEIQRQYHDLYRIQGAGDVRARISTKLQNARADAEAREWEALILLQNARADAEIWDRETNAQRFAEIQVELRQLKDQSSDFRRQLQNEQGRSSALEANNVARQEGERKRVSALEQQQQQDREAFQREVAALRSQIQSYQAISSALYGTENETSPQQNPENTCSPVAMPLTPTRPPYAEKPAPSNRCATFKCRRCAEGETVGTEKYCDACFYTIVRAGEPTHSPTNDADESHARRFYRASHDRKGTDSAIYFLQHSEEDWPERPSSSCRDSDTAGANYNLVTRSDTTSVLDDDAVGSTSSVSNLSPGLEYEQNVLPDGSVEDRTSDDQASPKLRRRHASAVEERDNRSSSGSPPVIGTNDTTSSRGSPENKPARSGRWLPVLLIVAALVFWLISKYSYSDFKVL